MTTATLPGREADKIRSLRENDDLDGLRSRVLALRQAGWTLAAIGEPLGAGRSTVRLWETKARASGLDDWAEHGVPSPPPRPSAAPRVARLRPDVPEGERARLRELAESARVVRGGTPADSPHRRDAEELDQLIEGYLRRQVAATRIAEHMGVTHRAVRARMERRHGVR